MSGAGIVIEVPGTASIILESASVEALPQDIISVPGSVTVSVNNASLDFIAEELSVVTITTVQLGSATLSVSTGLLEIVPGTTTVLLSEAIIVSSSSSITTISITVFVIAAFVLYINRTDSIPVKITRVLRRDVIF